MQRIISQCSSPFKTVKKARSISVVPVESRSSEAQTFSSDEEWIQRFRGRLMISDIVIDLIMIFVITTMMYLTHNLVPADTNLSSITEFAVCVFHILIQLCFEMLGDVASLYWVVKKENIRMNQGDPDLIDNYYWIWGFFTLWTSVNFFSWILATLN